MSGTDLACGTPSLRACYAMSGTDLAYAATRTYLPTAFPLLSPTSGPVSLRFATRSPVLT
eukprot:271265-Rhodomonas_salina.3